MLRVPDRSTKTILEMAQFFETLPDVLYNQEIFHTAGGSRCICGWTNHRHNPTTIESDIRSAQETLGLDKDTAARLFRGTAGRRATGFGWFFRSLGPRPSSKDAAACLRHLAVTGELAPTW